MSEGNQHKNVRELLILAGIKEIDEYGLQSFSIRRIANECGVSCAAPYKHFKDRQSFIAAIIEYINKQWMERQQQILKALPNDTRKQLVETSLGYVRFLVENPHFRSIIMLKDEEFDSIYKNMRGQISELSRSLIKKYCEEADLSKENERRKTYIIRSLIYGAALMLDNGEMEYNEESMRFVELSIDREFDLP
ncbi:MAG: TetR/AcrR family transcriptional regulator [Oscillospiraceae bacterium]|nr:TetR/AcrR family transcriptional regulator [Oscillospiraceae bacterium]